MDLTGPAAGRVILIVLVVLGYALSITVSSRSLKRLAFTIGSGALFFALVKASGGEGLIPVLYHWMRGEESWLTPVILGNDKLFTDYLAPLSDLALLFGGIAGIFAALALLGVKLLQQMAWLAVVALLAAFVGGLATIRMLSTGFGGYGTHDVFFGRPAPTDILDGDTLRLGTARLRLAGIDAPEYRAEPHKDWNEANQPCAVEGKLVPCGADARDGLIALAANKRVVCTRIAPDFADRFGRPLVSCIVHRPEEVDIELSERMAEDGLAAPAEETRRLDPAYLARLNAAMAAAPKKGIWVGCMIKPELWRNDAEIRESFKRGHWDAANLIDPKACAR